jgi:salicylate 1-O-methyltransferase
VFPCAIGRSFYDSVLPSNSVDIGWSSFAAMWLSSVPTLIPISMKQAPTSPKTRRAQVDG